MTMAPTSGILTIPTGFPVPDLIGTGANTTVTKVFMIWAIVPDQPEAPWLVTAMDADSVGEDEDVWLEQITAAEDLYGARFIRVTETTVNYDAVIQSYKPVTI